MAQCQQCRSPVEQETTICPRCGYEGPPADHSKWVSVARLRNLAEAGFFADVLSERQIDARVYQHDRFSALDGSWSMDYFLQVREPHAETAALEIQQCLDRDEAEPSWNFSQDEPVVPASSAWRPLMYAVMCGGLAYWVGQGMVDLRPAQEPSRRPMLWEVLDELDRPFVTPNEEGKSAYRIRVDAGRKRLYLEEDINGDGLYDRRLEFVGGRLTDEGGHDARGF